MFAPADRREHLLALDAFSLELARVREQVTETMLGQIRLQWWREAVDGIYAGTPRRHEVATALADAIVRHRLDRAMLERMIDAREADLADEPPADLAALEAYADGTAGQLAVASLGVLGADTQAAREAALSVGIAWALTGLLRATVFHARAKRLYLPAALLDRHGVDRGRLLELRGGPALAAAAHEIADRARHWLGRARAARSTVPRAALPVLLPARLADAYLRILARSGYDLMSPAIVERPPLNAWRVGVAALIGRY
jgi:phytoene synthase